MSMTSEKKSHSRINYKISSTVMKEDTTDNSTSRSIILMITNTIKNNPTRIKNRNIVEMCQRIMII